MTKTVMTSVLFFMVIVAAAISADAKSKGSSRQKAASSVAKPANAQSALGTNFSFEAAAVQGKYQMSGQGIATVEDEKVLDDLLGLRKRFNDRERQETSRW